MVSMLLWYVFISLALGFCGGFFNISSIIYSLLVMLRRGPVFAAMNAGGVILGQIIWIGVTIGVMLLFGKFYDPSKFDYWWDGLVVAAILFYVAYRFLVVNPKNDLKASQDAVQLSSKKQWMKHMSVGFVFTITTPQWAVAYLLILSAFNVSLHTHQWLASAAVGFGLLAGVVLFWFCTLLVLKRVHARASVDLARILNKVGAYIMIFFGCAGLADSIRHLF
jgi:MFS family permease